MSFLKTTAIQHLNAATPAINLAANGKVGLGISSPNTSLHIQNQNSGYSNPSDSDVPAIYLLNSANTSNTQHAYVSVRAGGSSGGNPFISFDLVNVLGYSAGIDNVDDKFKIVPGWSTVTSPSGIHMDINGRVNTPTQPRFQAVITVSSGVAWPDNGGNFVSYTNTPINIGSHFNASTGRFTAPISGIYQFTFVVSLQSTVDNNNQGDYMFAINNIPTESINIPLVLNYARAGGNWLSGCTTSLLSLNAGDFVTVRRTCCDNIKPLNYRMMFNGHLLG